MGAFLDYLKTNVTPGEAGNWIWATIYILVIFGIVSIAVMLMTWLERKIMAHMQVRLGPMRVGPHGLLQPIADTLKLVLKEDIIPEKADKVVFWLAPCAVMVISFATYPIIPFGRAHAVTDMNIGILFMLGVSSLGVLGIIMAGWASNSHYPLMGSLRSSAQMVSYEIAMGLAVISAILMTSLKTGTGTLSMIGIVESQFAQQTWFVFYGWGLGLLAFVIFAIAMIAETNRAPFDLPEAESELVAGFHTEYSGFRWSLFFLAEYASMIGVSAIAVTLWLGGWLRPFPNALSGGRWDLAFALFPALTFAVLGGMCISLAIKMPGIAQLRIQKIGLVVFGLLIFTLGALFALPGVRERVQDIYWFAVKVAFFMYMYIWYRATFPRYRFDQLMRVGWKVLLPTALGVLMATALWGVLR